MVVDAITVKAPAKVNLFLRVLNRRQDGFHNIHSLIQAVSLFDELKIGSVSDSGISLKVIGDSDVPEGPENLVYRAVDIMRKRYSIDFGFEIELTKRIPSAAGLGGGASDAAATLYGINRVLELGLDSTELSRIGLELGSDIPFFFSGGGAEVTGRGESIRNIALPGDYSILLVTPGFGIATMGAFEGLKMPLTSPADDIKLFCYKDFKDFVAGLQSFGNDFETGHYEHYPDLVDIRDALLNNGALLVRMSGSGPTIFGLFGDIPEGEGSPQFSRTDWQTNWVIPITLPAWD